MPKSRSKRSSYVPPSKTKPKSSPMWVAALFFTLIAAGVFVIIAHYLGIFPTGTQPYQLWLGLGMIASSFIVATQWH